MINLNNKKCDYISACESLFKYLDAKKLSKDKQERIMQEIIRDINDRYDFENKPNYCSSPLEYIEYKKKKKQ